MTGITRARTLTGRAVLAVLLTAVTILSGATMPAYAADVGFVGPVYTTSTTAPTGQKPQSKLWFADGIWWGVLFDGVSKDFHIFRFDSGTNRWTDTGVLVDERTNMYMDALWDGQKLYIASAGAVATNTTHNPRFLRFSYSTSTKKWSRDAGYPITPMGNGGVEAAVIAKDSTGLVWATFTRGSNVYVTHSTAGNDQSWVPIYKLPTPAGQSTVSPDDISAIVSFDGNKVGVLWSNQNVGVETMYWAWHLDGTSDRTWNLQIAYQQPQGADDHINLKSLIGDPSGRVYAVAKTSMNGSTQPIINLLVLSTTEKWSATPIWTVADNTSRAIVQIDTQARELYAFAAAPCCSGGSIYYKKSRLDSPVFVSGLGTPFISKAAHPKINNPTSTKQNLNGSTGLVVLAGDDSTRTYVFNRLSLGGTAPPPPPPPGDTTPPETTITSGPSPTTTETGATFAFTSDEAGSTFSCKLDGNTAASCTSPKSYTGLTAGAHTFTVTAKDPSGNADPTPASHSWTVEAPPPPPPGDTTPPETTITSGPSPTTTETGATFAFTSDEAGSTFSCKLDGNTAASCTSPKSYTGLTAGAHTFTVTAKDPSGNTDPTPASHSWTVEAPPPPPPPATTIFSDDFSSGNFTAGGWEVRVGADGTATVLSGAVEPGNLGARFVSTGVSGSSASARKTIAPQQRMTVSWDAKVAAANTSQFFTLAKIYASSTRVFSLVRNGSGALSVQDTGSTAVPTGANLATGQIARLSVEVVQGATDSVTLSINGAVVYTNSSLAMGSAAFTAVRMGDDAVGRTLDYRVDNVQVTP